MYVATNVQDKGVGSTLLEIAIKLSEKPLSLKCMVKNQKAITFYEAKGFIKLSKGSDDICDYYIMSNHSQK